MNDWQAVEIFFADDACNAVEAVVLPCSKGRQPLATQIAFAYRLLGGRAMMSEPIGTNWEAVVVCSAPFAKTHAQTPRTAKPAHTVLHFFGAQPE